MDNQAEPSAVTNSGAPLSIIGMGVRRRMQPPSSRRAVAFAIEMERTHDRLQRIIGHSLPLGARISALNSSNARPGRLSLPVVLDPAALDRLIQERAQAVEDLRHLFEDDDAAGGSASRIALGMIEQAAVWRDVEQRPETARRTRIHPMDPRSWQTADEMLMADMSAAADAPDEHEPRNAPVRPAWRPEERPRGAYAIDVMTDGLLTKYGVDRARLYEELEARGDPAVRRTPDLASPAVRSNTARTLRSLGHEFPPAIFRLRGMSLDVERVDLRIEMGGGTALWNYRGGNDPRMVTTDLLRGERIDGFHLQPLAIALRDETLHAALLTRQTDRRMMQEGGDVTTILRLFPRFTHLDAPEAPAGTRPEIEPAPLPPASMANHLKLRGLIAARLYVHDMHHRFQLNRRAGTHYEIVVGEQIEPNPLHRYVLSRDDVEGGDAAVRARVDEIAEMVRTAQTTRLEHEQQMRARLREEKERRDRKERERVAAEFERERRRIYHEDMKRAGEKALAQRQHLIQRLISSSMPGKAARSMVLLSAFGEEAAVRHHESTRIDAMVRTLSEADWKDLRQARANQVVMSLEEGILSVKSAAFGNNTYTRIGTERHAGKVTHVTGRFLIPQMTTPEWIEARRDGRLSEIFTWQGALGASQIIRIHQALDGIHIVVRLTLSSTDA